MSTKSELATGTYGFKSLRPKTSLSNERHHRKTPRSLTRERSQTPVSLRESVFAGSIPSVLIVRVRPDTGAGFMLVVVVRPGFGHVKP